MGKIQLHSGMSEFEIFEEIRSVFHTPMRDNDDFQFKILQSSGGDSRSLMVAELSASYKWSASAVAGKVAKTPIYILAEDNLHVSLWMDPKLCHAHTPIPDTTLR